MNCSNIDFTGNRRDRVGAAGAVVVADHRAVEPDRAVFDHRQPIRQSGGEFVQHRPDLAAEELAQVAVFQEFLPRQLTPEELEAEVRAVIAEVGATSVTQMGKVMGVVTKKLAGRADGKGTAFVRPVCR